ncbi:hypothetical protein JW968_04790 [Candidatus Woesearchaeota archaeon]|nr:hypothetical protein [Candidatus Woesearchaeota archaeon]
MARKLPRPPAPKVYETERKMGAIVSGIFVIILVFMIVFLTESMQKTGTSQSLTISNAQFAYYVDDDYNFEPNPTAAYNAGDDIFLYFEVIGYKTAETPTGYRTELTSDVQVSDPEGQLVPQLSRKNIFDEVFEFEADYGAIPVKTQFSVPSHFPSGEYTLEQFVYDKMTGDAVKLSKRFTIE